MDRETETKLYVSLLLIPVFLSILFYLIRNHHFYIIVNCWFCNKWSRAAYGARNSFQCPFCQQYNGFNEDGGYNKVIEAQFNASLNNNRYTYNNAVVQAKNLSNGLCTFCNYNQRMKVHLLANFVPLEENNYDFEVEHFQTQLENSYELCKKCDKILKTTLNQQKFRIFGNCVKNLMEPKKSIGAFVITDMIRYCLILILLTVFCQTLRTELIRSNADILLLKWVGLTLEIILFLSNEKALVWSINEILGWLIIIFISSNTFTENYFIYLHLLQIICPIAIIYSLSKNKLKRNRPMFKTKQLAFKKLQTISDEEYSDNDEGDHTPKSAFYPVKNLNVLTSQNKTQSVANTNVILRRSTSPPRSFRYGNNTNNPHGVNNFNMWRTNKDTEDTFDARSQSEKNFNVFRYQNTANTNTSAARSTRSLPNSFIYGSTDPDVRLNRNLNTIHVREPTTKLQYTSSNSWTATGLRKSKMGASQISASITNGSLSSTRTSGLLSTNYIQENDISNLTESKRFDPHSLFGEVPVGNLLTNFNIA